MKIVRILVILLLGINSIFGQDQPFVLITDTIYINIRGSIGPAIKYNNKYYCFFETSNSPYSSLSSKKLYIISSNGEIEKQIEIPSKMNATYYDLHIRNDSIIIKTYIDHYTFYLDPNELNWRQIREVDDLVYEDKRYYVTFLDFGEWGGTIWFKDKNTNIEYEVASSEPFINRINNVYYISCPKRVFKIEDPLKMKKCDQDYYYKTVEGNESVKFYEGSQSELGTINLFQDTSFSWFSRFYIATSFIYDNQLFHMCVDSNSVYVAIIDNRKIKKVQTIGYNFSVYDNYYSYRCKSLNNSQLLKLRTYDGNFSGFVEIDGNQIKIRYLKNNYSERYIGTKLADSLFVSLFDFIYQNMDNLFLSQIDSIARKIDAIDLTQDHKISLGTDYYPNKEHFELETPQIFKIIEDSTFTFFPQYFYTKENSSIKVAFLEWEETDNKKDDYFLSSEKNNYKAIKFKTKFDKIERYITSKVGVPLKEKRSSTRNNIIWKTENDLNLQLFGSDFNKYRNIRLIMYKE
jgi:hypothetical protein